MNKIVLYGLQISCIVVYFVVFCNAGGAMKQPKRLSNQQRLFPFPRIGRGGENSWNYGVAKSNKASLFAFPRVGRPDLSPFNYVVAKRNRNYPGVWFGPRLGKVQKRDVFLYDVPRSYPNELLYPSESQESRQVDYTPRLGRESDEDIDDVDVQTI